MSDSYRAPTQADVLDLVRERLGPDFVDEVRNLVLQNLDFVFNGLQRGEHERIRTIIFAGEDQAGRAVQRSETREQMQFAQRQNRALHALYQATECFFPETDFDPPQEWSGEGESGDFVA